MIFSLPIRLCLDLNRSLFNPHVLGARKPGPSSSKYTGESPRGKVNHPGPSLEVNVAMTVSSSLFPASVVGFENEADQP